MEWGRVCQLSDVLAMVGLCLMGTMAPSLLTVLYFLTFLALITWWALYKPIVRSAPVLLPTFVAPGFMPRNGRASLNRIKALVLVYMGGHIVLLYLYQLPYFYTWLSVNSRIARFGDYSPDARPETGVMV